ncbi:MAG: hypothetical protein ACJAZS_000052 [Alteromonas naphthalenivorans]|jgi:hypothetical protein
MNKKILFIIAALSFMNISQAASYGSSKLVTYVSKSNFMTVGAQTLAKTFNITSPGIYVLTEDITSVSTTRTILINSNNVTVDLNGYTITGKTDSSMNGIEVAQDMNNIEIKNGTIYSVGKSGILVNQNVHNIKISNVECNSCNINNVATTGGITLIGAVTPNEIAHCVIDNCLTFSTVPQTQNAYGIYANEAKYLTINNCRAENVRNIGNTFSSYGIYIKSSEYPIITNTSAYLSEGDTTAAGFYLLTCTSAQLINCESSGTNAADVVLGAGYGYYFEDTNNSLIDNCQSINNGGNGSVSGFYVSSCVNNRFLHCTANGNQTRTTSATGNATGFETTRAASKGATIACIFKNCTAMGQTALGSITNSAGFLLGSDTRFCIIEDSLSFGNNGMSGSAYGIYLSGASLLRCVIKGNNCFSNTAGSTSSVFGIHEDEVIANTYTFFFENTCAGNINTNTTPVGTELSSNKYTVPTYGTDLDTYDSTQSNTKGWNFIAASAHV